MALEQANEIDSVGIDIQTDNVVLSIIDGVSWENEHDHLILLQNKINMYLSFIESGEIFSSYPNAEGHLIVIKVYAKHVMPKKGIEFLEKASEVIKAAGFKMQWKITGAESR